MRNGDSGRRQRLPKADPARPRGPSASLRAEAPDLHYLRFLAARGTESIHPGARAGTAELLNALPIRDGQRLLEVGCGTGGTLVEVLELHRVRVVGVDLLREMLAVARWRLAATGHRREAGLVRARGALLPFRAESFDHAYAESVVGIQSAEDTEALLAEIFRVLERGGTFAMNEAIWRDGVPGPLAAEINSECLRLFGMRQASEQAWHLDDWLRLLESVGFGTVSAEPMRPTGEESTDRRGVGGLLSRAVTAAYRLRALGSLGAGRLEREYREKLARVRGLGAYVEARLFVLRKPP